MTITKMNNNENCLDIFLGQEKIAELQANSTQLVWNYTNTWQDHGYPISPHLPFSQNIEPTNTQIFLRNMLPEGRAFDDLITYSHVSRGNTFALIRILGADTSGALILLPTGSSLPESGHIRMITPEELQERLDKREHFNLQIWDDKPRLSLAGVQDKLNVIVDKYHLLGFGEGKLCSTHLLKFETHKLAHLVLNEFVTMSLAQSCDMEVAKVEMMRFGKNPALLVKRFDREFQSNENVIRRQVIDGCQALNLPPEYKYERNLGSGRDVAHIKNGASFAKLFKFSEQCNNPALVKMKIIDWAFFNILVFNCDAHGKNISFFINQNGIFLAPFYDLVNIKMYDHFNQEIAMAIGDEFDADNINAYQIIEFAEMCNVPRSFISNRLQIMANKILANIEFIINSNGSNAEEQEYLNKYQNLVINRCKYFLGKITDIKTLNV